MLLSAFASLLLPYETKGKNMGEAMLADQDTIHETSFEPKMVTELDIALDGNFSSSDDSTVESASDDDTIPLDFLWRNSQAARRRGGDAKGIVPITMNI
jgi:hypothetical protein